MEKKINIIDLKHIINDTKKLWIIKKNKPNTPVFIINNNDRTLIENEFFKKENNKINYSGKTYYISNRIVELLKKRDKNIKLENYGISHSEYIYPDQSENVKIMTSNIKNIINSNEKLFILSNYNNLFLSQENVDIIIEELKDLNIDAEIVFLGKSNLTTSDYLNNFLIEKIIGYKIDKNKFIDVETDRYNKIDSYISKFDIQQYINLLYYNSSEHVQAKVKKIIENNLPFVNTINISSNDIYNTDSEKIIIKRPIRLNRYNFFK